MSDEQKRRSAGWYAGAAVFWLLSAWMVTVGLSSIIPQIFAPKGNAQGHQGSCESELRALTDELLERSGKRMATPAPEADSKALTAWLESWDQRFMGARPMCSPSEQEAWAELSRLRHGMEGLVERFDAEEAPRVRKLRELLDGDTTPRAP